MPDPAIARHLNRIQEACREYVTQGERARKMTFASIRIAADAIAALSDEDAASPETDQVHQRVNDIQAAVDELAERFGSDEPGACRVCGRPLREARLAGGEALAYCANCPEPILAAVREVSDLTGADVL